MHESPHFESLLAADFLRFYVCAYCKNTVLLNVGREESVLFFLPKPFIEIEKILNFHLFGGSAIRAELSSNLAPARGIYELVCVAARDLIDHLPEDFLFLPAVICEVVADASLLVELLLRNAVFLHHASKELFGVLGLAADSVLGKRADFLQ